MVISLPGGYFTDSTPVICCKISIMNKDRKRSIIVRKFSLRSEENDSDLRNLSPHDLIGMMWQLALDAWSFKENLHAEPRLQRHLVVLKRGRG